MYHKYILYFLYTDFTLFVTFCSLLLHVVMLSMCVKQATSVLAYMYCMLHLTLSHSYSNL